MKCVLAVGLMCLRLVHERFLMQCEVYCLMIIAVVDISGIRNYRHQHEIMDYALDGLCISSTIYALTLA